MTQPAPSAETGTPPRRLGTGHLVALTAGTAIGSAIFVVPASILAAVDGAHPIASGAWVIGGLLTLLGAFSYAELAAAAPRAGGLYAWLAEAWGPRVAYVFGWSNLLVIGSGATAALGIAFARYAAEFVPLGGPAATAVALAMVVAVAAINLRGTAAGAGVQAVMTVLKVGAIVAIAALLLAAPAAAAPHDGAGPAAWTWTGAGGALVGVLWAYEGLHYATYAAGEAHDPARTFPRGLAIGTALVVLLYVLADATMVRALGSSAAMASPRIAADAIRLHYGDGAARAIAGVILLSTFSAANGVVFTTSRICAAMARDGLVPGALGRVHPITAAPTGAILATTAWALVLAATGTYEALFGYVVFAGWLFHVLGGLAVVRLRGRRAPGTFRVPGYPVTPLLFATASAAVLVASVASSPRSSGVGIILLGIAAATYPAVARGR